QYAVVLGFVVLSSVSAGAYVTGHPGEYWAKEGWVQSRDAFAVINEHGQRGDVVIMHPQILWSGNRYYDQVGGINATLLPDASMRASADALLANASTHDRVWFVVYTYHSPPGTTEQHALNALNATHTVSSASSYEGYRVYLLTKRA
ncbi:MAG: hypothetical protein ACXV2E_04955, partial [Halobacteriota archaeon]